jgi:hypothetical protein
VGSVVSSIAKARIYGHIVISMKLGVLNNGNPPAPITAAWSAPQCSARAKSTGQQCRRRATQYSIEQFGRPLCYLHGEAKGSGKITPDGKRRIAQAQLKHGYFTKEAV